MKNTDRNKFTARFTTDLHALLKERADDQGKSMHALVIGFLEESLQKFPIISSLPLALKRVNKPFVIRFSEKQHQQLLAALEGSPTQRSLNQEVVGRLMLMDIPSNPSIMDAWNKLSQSIAALTNACPSGEQAPEVQALKEAEEVFEGKLSRVFFTNTDEQISPT